MKTKLIETKDYLLLIDEEAEIEEGSKWVYDNKSKLIVKRIGNTFEAIEGLKQKDFVKIIGYRIISKYLYTPELDLPLLPNPFEEVDIEDLAKRVFKEKTKRIPVPTSFWLNEVKNYESFWAEGYKAAQSKQFSLEDMKKAIEMARYTYWDIDNRGFSSNTEGDWSYKYSEEEIIQSLSTQQLPSEFIPEYIGGGEYLAGEIGGNEIWAEYPKELETITNSEGKEELIGTYR